MSDTQERIGHLLRQPEKRDAVHIAVAPVIASHDLTPGQHIGFTREGETEMVHSAGKCIGIVDPFLGVTVFRGQRFWMFLYPNTITSLRHEWTHPAFATDPSRADSEAWLRAFADLHAIDYDEMVAGAVSGAGAYFGSADGPEEARRPEFWWHVESVTGRRFDPVHRDNTYFRCSC